MAESPTRTLVCSVLFLDIAGYTKRAVSEQQQMKEELNRLLASALEEVVTRERVILDTGDGAAVTFMGDPEDALFAAIAIRDGAGTLPVRMGINLGPVRLVKDLNGQLNIIGDGINAAQRVMSFAEPGQMLVSRSYYEVVSCLADDYVKMFHKEGARTDKHDRGHEVYSVVESASIPRRPKGAWSPPSRGGGAGMDAFDLSPPEVRTSVGASRQPAQVYDAGGNIVVSGPTRSSVEDELKKLVERGYRALSPAAQMGTRWVASCEHPSVSSSVCKVEELGYTRIVTGPTREAVAAKVEEMVAFGAISVGGVECLNGTWTAVCEAGAGER